MPLLGKRRRKKRRIAGWRRKVKVEVEEKVKVEVGEKVEMEENAVDAMEKDQGEPLNLILETSPIASHCLSPVKISLSLIWKVSSALFLVEDICSYSLLTLFFTLFLFFIFIDFFFLSFSSCY